MSMGFGKYSWISAGMIISLAVRWYYKSQRVSYPGKKPADSSGGTVAESALSCWFHRGC